jgi:hypothetical protein
MEILLSPEQVSDLIDLAEWRSALPKEWLVLLPENEKAALQAVQHRDLLTAALNGQIPAIRLNRRWSVRRSDLCVIGKRLIEIVGARRAPASSAMLSPPPRSAPPPAASPRRGEPAPRAAGKRGRPALTPAA